MDGGRQSPLVIWSAQDCSNLSRLTQLRMMSFLQEVLQLPPEVQRHESEHELVALLFSSIYTFLLRLHEAPSQVMQRQIGVRSQQDLHF